MCTFVLFSQRCVGVEDVPKCVTHQYSISTSGHRLRNISLQHTIMVHAPCTASSQTHVIGRDEDFQVCDIPFSLIARTKEGRSTKSEQKYD